MAGHSNHHVNPVSPRYGKDQVERIVSVEIDVIKLAGQEGREVVCAHVVVEEEIVVATQVGNENGGFWERPEVLKLKPGGRSGEYRCRNLAIREVYQEIEVVDS
jgi:hypothetical protein